MGTRGPFGGSGCFLTSSRAAALRTINSAVIKRRRPAGFQVPRRSAAAGRELPGWCWGLNRALNVSGGITFLCENFALMPRKQGAAVPKRVRRSCRAEPGARLIPLLTLQPGDVLSGESSPLPLPPAPVEAPGVQQPSPTAFLPRCLPSSSSQSNHKSSWCLLEATRAWCCPYTCPFLSATGRQSRETAPSRFGDHPG